MRGQIIALFILLNISLASAATISGNIYDLNLDKAKDVILSIDTIPKQAYVSKDGFYTFNAPIGNYVINASYKSLLAKESIVINDAGNYTLDLILYPNIDEEEADLLKTNISEENALFEPSVDWPSVAITIITLALVAGMAYFFYKRKKSGVENLDDAELDKIMAFIRKEGSRTTQKDIRKEFPLSEAKISLMITELEHKGLVERIKKGRGNVIILKK